MKTIDRQPTRRKAQRFGGAAKTAVSIAAAATLLGGWNLLVRIDNAEADATNVGDAAMPVQAPTFTNTTQPTAIALPTLAPLVIAPVPTLKAVSNLPQPVNGATVGSVALALPDMPALAPLPTLAPLPSMPSLPPPPPAPSSSGGSGSSNGGSSNGGGQTNSGGS